MSQAGYIVANKQENSSQGSNSNLYNEEELLNVNDVQRRISLIAFEERENKLQRAEVQLGKSKISKKSGPSKPSARADLKKEILSSNKDFEITDEKRERFEKALASGKAVPKDSKSRATTTRNAITTSVLGTQDSGVMKKPLDNEMKAKLNRAAATVAANGAKGEPFFKKNRGGIVGTLMRSFSRDALETDDPEDFADIEAARPIEPYTSSSAARPAEPYTSSSAADERSRKAYQKTAKPPKPNAASASKPLAKRRQSIRSSLV